MVVPQKHAPGKQKHDDRIPNMSIAQKSAEHLSNEHWRGKDKYNLQYGGTRDEIPITPLWTE